MQRVFSNQLDVTDILRLVSRRHNSADVVRVGALATSRLASRLLVPCDASTNAEVALDSDLRLLGTVGGRHLVSTELSSTVQTRRMYLGVRGAS